MRRFLALKNGVADRIGRAGASVVDLLLPPLCLNCDQQVTRHQTFCASCWKEFHFVAPPFCARCGAPFDLPVDEGTLCGACLDKEPSYALARSALIYDDASKPMILRLKHADRLHPVPALAHWMVRAGGDMWGAVDLIAPVPLHRWRLLKRRYNQAALLAQSIGKMTGKTVQTDLLRRVRRTESQGHLNYKKRHENVAKAFVVPAPSMVNGKVVALVDDVLTSGATVEACTQILLKAGAASVFVVTLARTRLAS